MVNWRLDVDISGLGDQYVEGVIGVGAPGAEKKRALVEGGIVFREPLILWFFVSRVQC